jgi:hypothetical protein
MSKGGMNAARSSPPVHMMAAMAMDSSFEQGGAPEAMMMGGGMAGVVDSMKMAEGAAPGGPPPLSGPVVLMSANMNVETLVVASALAAVQAAVLKMGGAVTSSSSSSDEWMTQQWREAGKPLGGPTHAHLALRVPAPSLDAARAAVTAAAAREGGRVTNENSNAQDVTEQYVDTVARIRVDERSLAALEALLAAADSVNDVLSVRREMSSIVARLESGKGQRKSFESRAEMSSLFVSFAVPPPSPPSPPTPPGWSASASLQAALASLSKGATLAVDVGIYTAVFALPVVLVTLVLAAVVRTVRARMGWGYAAVEAQE